MKDINIKVNNSDILTAFSAIDSLWAIRGQARNRRIEVLTRNRENSVLKNLVSLAYDFTHSFQVSIPDQLMGENPESNLEQNYCDFLALTRALTYRECAGLKAHRECLAFLREKCGRTESRAYLHVLQHDLHCGISLRLAGKIWPDLDMEFDLPKTETDIQGMRAYFILRDGHIVCYSDGFREFPFFEATFGAQLKRGSSGDVIIEAMISSKDWEFTEKVLHSKIKTFGKRAWKDAFYGIRCTLLNSYPVTSLFKSEKSKVVGDQQLLSAIHRHLKEQSPRTLIRLLS